MFESGTVIRDDTVWQGHPDVARFNDQLYIAFRESENHRANTHTKIRIVRSGDGARFGSPLTVMETKEEGRYNCPRLKVIFNRLYLVCDIIRVKKDIDQDFKTAENDVNNTSIHIIYTEDGETWSPIIRTDIRGIVPDRIFTTQKGDFLIATHMWQETEKGKGVLVQNVWHAKEIDTKWEVKVLASHFPYNLCEASISSDKHGKLVCLMRENSQQGHPAFISFSTNAGKTWTPISKTLISACHRPVLGLLRSGNFLVTYREQTSVFEGRYWSKNTFAALINSKSLFQHPHCNRMIILPIDHDNSIRSDGGYTGWIQLPDEQIYIVNYICKGSVKPYIKWYKLRESDF